MPKMPPWPKERVAQSFPFEYTGLDYMGPLYVNAYSGESSLPTVKKVWVCLFTCVAIRAVHLEVVEDLSAQEFLCVYAGLQREEVHAGKSSQIMLSNLRQQVQ